MDFNKIKSLGLFFSFCLFLTSIFILNPEGLTAQTTSGDSGTCCPDTGICVIDGKVIGRTHYYKSDGKCDDSPVQD